MRVRSLVHVASLITAGCAGAAAPVAPSEPVVATVASVPQVSPNTHVAPLTPNPASRPPELTLTEEKPVRERHEVPPAHVEAPGKAPGLGTRCTTGTVGCGSAARVAFVTDRPSMQVMMGPATGRAPCVLERIQSANVMGPYEASACVESGRIYVLRACVACRLPGVGESVTGVVEEMTPAQVAAMQAAAGLAPSPALTTERAWRDAIAKAAAAIPARRER
jgi:hypothetical protein